MSRAEDEIERKVHQLTENAKFKPRPPPGVETGGGGGDSTGMDQRVTRLEEWSKLAGERMGRIEDKLDTILSAVAKVPTRTDMLVFTLTGLGLALAVVGAIVGALAVLTP